MSGTDLKHELRVHRVDRVHGAVDEVGGAEPSLPKFDTVHGPDAVGRVICGGAGKTCFTVLPCSALAASTNGLNVDPACRPAAALLAPGKVDLQRVVVTSAHVRADRATLVQRDECSLRIVGLVSTCATAASAACLIVEIQRRGDAQPPAVDTLSPN